MSDTFNPTPFFQNDRAEAFYKELQQLKDLYPDCYIEAWTPRDFFPEPDFHGEAPVDTLDLAPSTFARNCQVVENLTRMHSADVGVNWSVVHNAVAELPEEVDASLYKLAPPAKRQVFVVCVHHKYGQDFLDIVPSQEEVLKVQAGWCASYIDELPEEHHEAAKRFAEAGDDKALVELYTTHHPQGEYFDVYEGMAPERLSQ